MATSLPSVPFFFFFFFSAVTLLITRHTLSPSIWFCYSSEYIRTFEIETLLTINKIRSDLKVFLFDNFYICVQGGRDNSSGYDSTDEEVGLSKSSPIGALKGVCHEINWVYSACI
jgi:hypothetical protein